MSSETEPESGGPIEGDRGVLSVDRRSSLQNRVTNMLAMGLIAVWTLGMAGWYYVHHFQSQVRAKQAARSAPRQQAQGDMPLPSLGRITPPPPNPAPVSEPSSTTNLLIGPPPDPPPDPVTSAPANPPTTTVTASAPSAAGAPAHPGSHRGPLARRLSGSAFSSRLESAAPSGPGDSANEPVAAASLPMSAADLPHQGESAAPHEGLTGLLKPTVTEPVRAAVLPTRRLLLSKGAFIDCTLETAIDSTLPGMTTCVTATDTFSADGSVVLFERGTKLVGETRGEVAQGSARVFVLWTEARTPTGVVVPLDSPGTDSLGRSGLTGEVDRHFFARFGAAMLISVLDGVVQAAVQSSSRGAGTVIYNPSSSEQIATEILKGTLNIPPTIRIANGERIQILVARDVDFRSVYELRAAGK